MKSQDVQILCEIFLALKVNCSLLVVVRLSRDLATSFGQIHKFIFLYVVPPLPRHPGINLPSQLLRLLADEWRVDKTSLMVGLFFGSFEASDQRDCVDPASKNLRLARSSPGPRGFNVQSSYMKNSFLSPNWYVVLAISY